jgi:outer membrane receptor protein involved in Fe transport
MKKLFPAISALPLVALSSQPVFAQETETAAEPSENVIIVTAQLREENVQEVPIAITALTGENIRNARIEDALAIAIPAILNPATLSAPVTTCSLVFIPPFVRPIRRPL